MARLLKFLSVLGVAWLVGLAIGHTDGGVGLLDTYLLMFGGPALALFWLISFVPSIAARGRQPSPAVSILWKLLTPSCLLAGAILAFTFDPEENPLFRLRFRLSENALTREAQTRLESPESFESTTRRVGLFLVHRITVHDRQVRFITTSCGVIDSCGVVYSAEGPPQRWQEDEFSQLTSPWWHVYEGF
jgi:hypothetical protein